MKITVPVWAREHFWEEPPNGSREFWAFRFKPRCQVGDEINFRFDRKHWLRQRSPKFSRPARVHAKKQGDSRICGKSIGIQRRFRI